MSIRVIYPGLLTTIQDMGRIGHAAEGYPECGACDKLSYRKALYLSGNSFNEGVLECTLLGPTLEFQTPAIIAVSGKVHPLLNGQPVPTDFPVWVDAHSVLCIGPVEGMYAYVAVYGGLDVPAVLGSRATDRKSRIGGFQGRELKQNDLIPLRGEATKQDFLRLRTNARRAACLSFPKASQITAVHVIPGPQADAFTEEGLNTFFRSEYAICPNSDRMGLRLSGPTVASVRGTDILSDGILEGSVQITANGQPIVMMADHQTTGGYAKIATVVPQDICLLAQLRPGSRIRFVQTDLKTATMEYRKTQEELQQLMQKMKEMPAPVR